MSKSSYSYNICYDYIMNDHKHTQIINSNTFYGAEFELHNHLYTELDNQYRNHYHNLIGIPFDRLLQITAKYKNVYMPRQHTLGLQGIIDDFYYPELYESQIHDSMYS